MVLIPLISKPQIPSMDLQAPCLQQVYLKGEKYFFQGIPDVTIAHLAVE